VLAHTGGNQLKAAEILGLNRNTRRKKLAGLGIEHAHAKEAPAKPPEPPRKPKEAPRKRPGREDRALDGK
jgi:Bacterial regulatory protein, Fis family